jgi:hypothetical protein
MARLFTSKPAGVLPATLSLFIETPASRNILMRLTL